MEDLLRKLIKEITELEEYNPSYIIFDVVIKGKELVKEKDVLKIFETISMNYKLEGDRYVIDDEEKPALLSFICKHGRRNALKVISTSFAAFIELLVDIGVLRIPN